MTRPFGPHTHQYRDVHIPGLNGPEEWGERGAGGGGGGRGGGGEKGRDDIVWCTS